MLSHEIEKHFVDTFVLRNRRERMLFELNLQKKRVGVIRFFDTRDLIPDCVHELKGISNEYDALAQLQSRGVTSQVYLFRENLKESGMVSLKTAMKMVYERSCIVYDPTVPLAYFMGGAYEKYCLY